MKKRIISILLAIALLCALLPAAVLTASAETYSGTCGADGDNLTWTLDTQTGLLTISGFGEMYQFSISSPSSLFPPWYKYRDDGIIQKVIVEPGVTTIGSYAFAYCRDLKEVILPSSIISIGKGAFTGTSLPKIDGSLYVGDWLIKASETLTEVKIGTVGIADRAFENTKSTEIHFPHSLQYIGQNVFNGSVLLNDRSNWTDDVFYLDGWLIRFDSSVTDYTVLEGTKGIAEEAFLNASIKSIALPDSVRYVCYGAFCNCKSLISVELPDHLGYIAPGLFAGDLALEEIAIPRAAKYIGSYAFNGCAKIEFLTIPENVQWIDSKAFYKCSNLSTLTLPSTVVRLGEHVFTGTSSLAKLEVDAQNPCFCSDNNVLFTKDRTQLLYFAGNNRDTYAIPDSVTAINKGAFYESKLSSLTFSPNVTCIGEFAFYKCSRLTDVYFLGEAEGLHSIQIGENNGSLLNALIHFSDSRIGKVGRYDGYLSLEWYLTEDGVLFFERGDIVSSSYSHSFESEKPSWYRVRDRVLRIELPEGLTSIGRYAFADLSSLPSVTIPDSVTEIGEAAFSGCHELTSVIIGSGVTKIGDSAFFGCSRVSAIYISDVAAWCQINFTNYNSHPGAYSTAKDLYLNGTLVTDLEIPDSVTSIGAELFGNYTSLTSVTIGDSVESIGEEAFYNCTGLQSVTIGNSVESIGEEAFYDCEKLTSITIPDSVLSIGKSAFSACKGLTSVTFGKGLTIIDNGVFSGCTGLSTVVIPSGVTSIGNKAFRYCTGLTSIAIPVGVTSIGEEAFYTCRKLTSLMIPDSVTSIGDNAFFDCNGLTSVTIPNSVTSIGNQTFFACSCLMSVMIPNSVTSIGEEAFGYTWRDVKIDGFTIYGYKDSAAQVYAEENGFTFIDLENMPCKHEHAHPEHKGATCTEDGYDRIICDDCGEIISEEILPALGHNIIIDPAISATCTEAGLTEGEHCTRCDYKIGQQIAPALGHNIVVDPAIPATCTASGLTEGSHCTRCDYRVQQEATPALGHVWNDGEITKPATETENGMKTYACTRCGATKTEIIPATGEEACKHEHAHPEHKGATCTEDGYDRMICDDCGAVLSEESISKLGHSFKTTLIAPTCTEKGYTFYECTREGCGYTEKGAWADALGHDFKDGVCTVCGAKDPDYKPVTPTTFNDVKETAWYFNAVNYAVSNGLMNGVGYNNFAPDAPMTRAMLVTVLWRYENSPEEGKNAFTDVPSGEWYTKAVAWAAHNGIVGGVGGGRFDPNGNITREQMAAILYRYANGKGFDTAARGDLSKFPDASKVSSWAKDAIAWAVADGIIGGSDGKLLPQGNATRAQVATILMRFIEGAKNAAPYDTQGHTYEFFCGMYSWADAQKAAAEKGGYLARFDSEDEFRYVTNEITKAGYRDVNFIIGARRADGSKDYYFVDADGKPVGGKLNAASSWASAYWASGEPTYEWNGDQEWIVALEYKADEAKWTLNDIPDNAAYPVDPNRHGFIIEYEP